jgi:hypothetical protein
MPAAGEDLVAAVRELERVLGEPDGPGRLDRLARLDRALDAVGEAAHLHLGALYHPDGLISGVDRPRLPSPAVDREAGKLLVRLERLLRELHELRARVPVSGTPAALAGPADLVRRARVG